MMKAWKIALAVLLCACSADSEYSSDPCYFAYQNQYYLDPALASAMDSQVRGVFCQITESQSGGAIYLNFLNNSGLSSKQKETSLELTAGYVLGVNNGIIVGFQTFNTTPNGGFAAYDLQCPNCLRKHSSAYNPRYQLTMESSGIATCKTCGKRYDMNTAGMVLNGEKGDVKLKQYIATTTGPHGFIQVKSRR